MNPAATAPLHGLGLWVAAVQRRAALVLVVLALLGAGLAAYAARKLSVDTSTENMLSAELPWRRADIEMRRHFPQLNDGLVVVIDGRTPEAADAAQARLVAALRAEPQRFGDVFALETEAYFRRNGLLYLEPQALEQLASQLNQAQPFLGALNRDPSLRGLAGLLTLALQTPEARGFDLSPALQGLTDSVEAALAGRSEPLSWQSLMGAASLNPNPDRRFITLSPQRDFRQLLPAAAAIDRLRALAQTLQIDADHGLRMRLTGAVALEHEELLSAFKGTGLVMALALIMVAALLLLALRSLRLVIAAVLTLIYGLVATAAFAAAAVGHLNLISIAFGVLYVGLGIDYALYLCMQFRERLGQGLPQREALSVSAQDVGGFMVVCAATTSIGFFAFVPTSFSGIAELGLISGGGMFISLAVSLTLLPALIAVLPPDAQRIRLQPVGSGRYAGVLEWPYRYARAIWIVAALLAVAALLLVPRARFDADPLNLRDPDAESVATFRELLRDPGLPALTLSVLAPDAAAAQALGQRLSALPGVARALSLQDFVPRAQEQKLPLIEDLALSLDLPEVEAQPASDADDLAALAALRTSLSQHASALEDKQAAAAQGLSGSLKNLDTALASAGSVQHAQLLQRLRDNLLGSLPAQLAALRLALQAGAVSEADLPAALLQRWRSDDGRYRVEVWPRAVLDTPQAMAAFVDEVRAVEPSVSGPPVGFIEAGRTVVQSFREAFTYSLVAITLLLLVLLRSLRDTLLVLIPLLLAGLLTLAAMVLLGVSFNFANVIALPLVLGVGVDYGVYLVQRGRAAAASGENLLRTSTARAVLYGALITIADFGNLMLAQHPGMVSMGLLLTVGLAMTLLCALVLLPSLLARRYRVPDRA